MSKRRLLAIALAATIPGTAAAQFTTFIPRKDKVKDSLKAEVVAEKRALSDSITKAQLTAMKAWVDSVAGIPGPPPSADSLARPDSLRRPDSRARSDSLTRRDSLSRRNPARRP